MKQLDIRALKFCIAALLLLGSFNSKAQISYWSQLTVSNPFHSSDGLLGCMAYKNGKLYVPYLDYAGHTAYLAILSNGTWQNYAVPQSFDTALSIVYDDFYAIAVDDFGHVYMAGGTADTSGAVVIVWDGLNFSKVGPDTGPGALHTNNGFLYNFDDNIIYSMCFDQAGNLNVGGAFADAQGHRYIAKWDGAAWSTVGYSTMLKPEPQSGQLGGPTLVAKGNNLYCAAAYGNKGLMFWNGSTWANIDTVGSPLNIITFVIGPSGNIYAGAYNDTAYMYNGSTWSVMGSVTGFLTGLRRMYVDSAENVYFAGYPTDPAGNYYVGKWDGTRFNELGINNYAIHATYYIYDINSLPGGDIIACGGTFDGDGYPYVAVCHTLPANRLGISLSATPSNCSNNGSITSSVVHGTPPYTYAWSTGDTTANVDSLAGGSYYVTVTDSAGLIAMGYAIVPGSCLSVITGKIFIDTSGLCLYNGTQQGVGNVTLTLSTGSIVAYAYTDGDGNYSFTVSDTGNYTLAALYNGGGCGQLIACNQQAAIYIDSLGDSSTGNNFRLDTTGGSFDLTLFPGWGAASPGQQKAYWMAPVNLSSVPYHGTVSIVFTYDTVLVYDSSSAPPAVVDTTLHTITWTISGDSVPFHTYAWNRDRYIAYFTLPASVSPGYLLHADFLILPDSGDCNPANNRLNFANTVVGSHDPNFKEVSPAGNLSPADSVLTYTIHFQNTGTDSTFFITVTDTLSQYLNPATVLNLASSFPYTTFNISGTGALTWAFNPYYLPDSASNPNGSNGFVTFSVHKKSDIPAGAGIVNSANVYFDYNQPVITNYVTDSVIFGVNYTTLTGAICPGDTFRLWQKVFVQPGVYTDTFTNAAMFDSIVTLTLTVTQPLTSTRTATTCTGIPYNFNGRNVNAAGTYYDTLIANTTGCDSIVTLNLTVVNQDTINLFGGLCAGDSVYFYGRYITHVGTYDTLLLGGCDTVAILSLVVQDPLPPTNIFDTICANGRVLYNNTYYDTTGVYNVHFNSLTSCDSTVNLHLTVHPVSRSTNTQTICSGDSVLLGTAYYKQTGNFTDTLQTQLGCDSIITLNLTVTPAVTSTRTGTTCQGIPYNFNGRNLNTAGTYYDTLIANQTGCDSIVTLNLSVNQPPVVTLFWDTLIGHEGFFAYMGDTVYCHEISNVVVMAGGTPYGGIYTGPAIINNIFYADSALTYLGITLDTITYTYTDSNGCVGSASNTVGLYNCLGIQPVTGQSSISIYPNPARTQLFIKTENLQPVSITVYDVDGRTIITQPFKPEIDINQLSPGVYFIEITGGGEVARERFVKM